MCLQDSDLEWERIREAAHEIRGHTASVDAVLLLAAAAEKVYQEDRALLRSRYDRILEEDLIKPQYVRTMPNQIEQELLALLQKATAQEAARKEPALPELKPEMFMSVAAQREVQAAQAPVLASIWSTDVTMSRIVPEEDDSMSVERMPSLSDLLLAEAQREVSDFSPVSDISEDFDFEFSTGEIEGTTSPNEAARFQIGRQSPPRSPFQSSDVRSGPSEGEVVSRRIAGRGFQASAPTARPPREELVQRQRASAPVKPAPEPPRVRSYYERLLDSSVVD